MKVLHIINSLIHGGAETLLVDLCIEAKKRGYDFEILMITSDNFFEELLQKNNIRYSYIPYNKKIDYRNILFLKNKIKEYDIVHSHLFPSNYYVALANILNGRKKGNIITTEHSTSNRRRKYLFFKYIDRIIYKQYSKVICISNGVKKSLIEWGISPDNLVIIENGVNVEKFLNASKNIKENNEFIEKNKKMILMIGSFKEAKDQKTLIKAINLLNESCYLVLVGEGPLRKSCEEVVENMNLTNRVKFLGNRDDVENIIANSYISVLSSKYEGFGIAALECMANGKPTIGTNVEGLNEIIVDELLFNVGDYKKLSNIIKLLLNNREYYLLMSRKCLIESNKFTVNSTLMKLIELYNSII